MTSERSGGQAAARALPIGRRGFLVLAAAGVAAGVAAAVPAAATRATAATTAGPPRRPGRPTSTWPAWRGRCTDR